MTSCRIFEADIDLSRDLSKVFVYVGETYRISGFESTERFYAGSDRSLLESCTVYSIVTKATRHPAQQLFSDTDSDCYSTDSPHEDGE